MAEGPGRTSTPPARKSNSPGAFPRSRLLRLTAYGLRLTAYGLRLTAYFTVIVIFIPSATCGMQYALYVPAGAPANETSYFSFGCVRNGPIRSPIGFGIPFFRASVAPFGIESA